MNEGTVEEVSFTDKAKDLKINVYTPYNYDETQKYDVMVLMGGLYSTHNAWLTSSINLETVKFKGKFMFDNMIENGDCRPLIIVSIGSHSLSNMGKYLRNIILPYVVSNYSTYATSMDDISLYRDHFAIGGFSWGGYSTYYNGMRSMLDVFSSFCPVAGSTESQMVVDSIKRDFSQYKINYLISGCGNHDGTYKTTNRDYKYLVDNLPQINNSMFIEVNAPHSWKAASTIVFNFLQIVFP